jgi:hypothetical protein
MVAIAAIVMGSVTEWKVARQAWAGNSEHAHDNAPHPLVLGNLTFGSSLG